MHDLVDSIYVAILSENYDENEELIAFQRTNGFSFLEVILLVSLQSVHETLQYQGEQLSRKKQYICS